MRYIELFGGIGGFSYGIRKANQSLRRTEQDLEERGNNRDSPSRGNEKKKQKFSCVYYSEIDKYAVQTYNKNFGTSWKPTDIRKVPAEQVPDHNLLCAGFPCQSFSIAGKRKGFVDTRGTLFFEICRIAQVKRPKILFLENVKGLLNHDEGRTFATILQSLFELGYWVEWQVLNSKHYGVPQNRERVFIIGHLGKEPRQKVFPIGESHKNITESKGKVGWAKSKTTISGAIGMKQDRQHNTYIVHNLQPRSPDRPSYKKAIEAGLPKPGGSGHLTKNDGMSYCLDSTQSQAIEYSNNIRRLTPTECERLQGFPDGWTEGVSDSQRYKLLGNAVTTNVIEAITRKIQQTL